MKNHFDCDTEGKIQIILAEAQRRRGFPCKAKLCMYQKLSYLASFARESFKRNIFLISHRDELIGRVTSVLKVIKEGGFTEFNSTDTNLI